MKKHLFLLPVLFINFALFSQSLEWATGASSSAGEAIPSRIATDSFGNIYTVGFFLSTMDFDPDPNDSLILTGFIDMFIQKTDATGDLLWVKQFPSNVGSSGYLDLAIGTLGNCYVSSSFSGTADFNPDTSVNNSLTSNGLLDVFLLKLDPLGNFIWARSEGGSSSDTPSSITLDAAENIYVTGSFQGNADFDPDSVIVQNLQSNGLNDIFIQKLDSSGNLEWVYAIGGVDYDYSAGITIDASMIYINGHFSDTIDFNPDSTVSNEISALGTQDIFILKMDENGNFIWVKRVGNTGALVSTEIIDANLGGIILKGYFEGTVDFDPHPSNSEIISATNSGRIFIQKIDTAGNFVWVKAFAEAIGLQQAVTKMDFVTDAFGNIYTTGSFNDNFDFDPDSTSEFMVSPLALSDIFIQKFDGDGNMLWTSNMGALNPNSNSEALAVTTDPFGDILVTGFFSDTVDFDPSRDTFYLGTKVVFHAGLFQLKLNPCGLDTTVMQTGPVTLTAQADRVQYQWLNCTNGCIPIPTATDSSYTVTTNGSYAVEITQNECVDTSALYNISVLEIPMNDFSDHIQVYPNPSADYFIVDLGAEVDDLSINIKDVTGKIVATRYLSKVRLVNFSVDEPSGLYFIEIYTNLGNTVIKVMVD